jgi:aminopeptidase N
MTSSDYGFFRYPVTSVLLAVAAILTLTQCNTTKKVVAEPMEIRVTDTIYVSQEEEIDETPAYRATYTRTADLLHTDLNISFNYELKAVYGKAKLTFTPVFYPVSEITLDAKSFEIKETSMSGRPVEYDYKNNMLTITLDKSYKKGEPFDVYIQYTAFPYREAAGGSAAIISDRGLYFIDADERDPYKPTQVWTQGETESSSRWFPTIDKPNERCTQKIRIRVKDEYQTLSNGLMTDSKDNGDGSRTDTWEMTQPHAPYLFMLAVGDFHREKEMWGNVPLEYIVEHDYANDAKKIFEYTPEMLTFFSDKLDYPYPWPKYSQIIVRDYVSGAMENTTASLFGQFVQHPAGDLVDNGNDKIVAHEMFHQWFGDLVTCESWSNLTLNEGFANYSEYLWVAHKYGRDEGEHHRYTELQGYLSQAQNYAHPLVDFHYRDKEDMFDAHSYNKGGLILHMLRNIVGDDAFFASLNRYLNEKEYQAVEVHDLRLAFEETTGQDLNWFFNQWFLQEGHPIIDMDHAYSPETKFLTLNINQIQDEREWPLFHIPTEVEIYTTKGTKVRKKIIIDQFENSYYIELNEAPELVMLDPLHIQLMEMTKDNEPSLLLYDNAKSVWERLHALDAITSKENEENQILIHKGLQDSYWMVRLETINRAGEMKFVQDKLKDIVLADPHANVRVAAIEALAQMEDDVILKALNDKSNQVRAAAAAKLMEQDGEQALAWAKKNEMSTSQALLQAVADIYVDQKIQNKSEFFNKSADRMSFDTSFPFYITWAGYLVNEGAGVVIPQLEAWSEQIKSDDTDVYKKYAILTALQPLAQHLPMDKYDDENKKLAQSLMQKIGKAAAMMFGGE